MKGSPNMPGDPNCYTHTHSENKTKGATDSRNRARGKRRVGGGYEKAYPFPTFQACFRPPLPYTWEAQVSHNKVLAIRGIANPWEVDINHEEEHTGHEGKHANGNAITAGILAVVKDTEELVRGRMVGVAFTDDTGEDYEGKHLQTKSTMQWGDLVKAWAKKDDPSAQQQQTPLQAIACSCPHPQLNVTKHFCAIEFVSKRDLYQGWP